MTISLNKDGDLGLPDDAKLVAFYHHHTPSGEGIKREVGLSVADIRGANDFNITAILKDFTGELDSEGRYVVRYTESPNDLETQFYFQHSNQ